MGPNPDSELVGFEEEHAIVLDDARAQAVKPASSFLLNFGRKNPPECNDFCDSGNIEGAGLEPKTYPCQSAFIRGPKV
jgi:hypothetical protein